MNNLFVHKSGPYSRKGNEIMYAMKALRGTLYARVIIGEYLFNIPKVSGLDYFQRS